MGSVVPGGCAGDGVLHVGSHMRPFWKRVRDDRGQDVIEYALLAAGISIVVIPTVPNIGVQLVFAYYAVLAAVTGIA